MEASAEDGGAKTASEKRPRRGRVRIRVCSLARVAQAVLQGDPHCVCLRGGWLAAGPGCSTTRRRRGRSSGTWTSSPATAPACAPSAFTGEGGWAGEGLGGLFGRSSTGRGSDPFQRAPRIGGAVPPARTGHPLSRLVTARIAVFWCDWMGCLGLLVARPEQQCPTPPVMSSYLRFSPHILY